MTAAICWIGFVANRVDLAVMSSCISLLRQQCRQVRPQALGSVAFLVALSAPFRHLGPKRWIRRNAAQCIRKIVRVTRSDEKALEPVPYSVWNATLARRNDGQSSRHCFQE